MSGHSKWSTIKHKKGAADAKRGKLFSRLIKEVTIASRMGGGDPSGNPRLRSAIAAAKSANLPGDTLDRAIKRGTGELEGIEYEEISYEGYGPGGVAVMVEVMTDNKNRTVAEIRHLFNKFNGKFGEAVSWMFTKMGVILIPKEGVDEDQVMEQALEAGAEDVKDEEGFFEVHCSAAEVDQIAEQLRESGLNVESAEAAMMPQNTIKVEGRDAEVLMRLMGFLEDHDDVQNVWSNFDIDDDLLEKLTS